MLGIVFTTPYEASTFADLYGARADGLEEDRPIQIGDAVVAVTGPGKIKAALATERLLRAHDLDRLVHGGTCTALDDELEVGAVVGASFVLEGDRVELDAPVYPRMPLECPFDVDATGTLVSQDHTTGAEEPSYWERLADVRDETGYAVAYVAAQHGVPCHVVKAVSPPDDATDAGKSEHETAAANVASLLRDVADRAASSEA
jgi:nucleoside phosphorylase